MRHRQQGSGNGPQEVRRLLRLTAGDRMLFVDQDERVVILCLRSVDDASKRPGGVSGKFPGAKK